MGAAYLTVLLSIIFIISNPSTGDEKVCRDTYLHQRNAKIFRQVTPRGNTSAGRYMKVKGATTIKQCVLQCCRNSSCNVVFMFDTRCYLIACVSEEACQPLPRQGLKFLESYMVLMRPVNEQSNFEDDGYTDSGITLDNVLNLEDMRSLLEAESILQHYKTTDDGMESRIPFSDMVEKKKAPMTPIKTCYMGFNDCPDKEECVFKNARARHGTCSCINGFVRDADKGTCRQMKRVSNVNSNIANSTFSSLAKNIPSTYLTTTLSPVTVTSISQLVVSAGENKILQLPDNEVTLSAYALAKDSKDSEQYHYEWTLVSHPDGDDTGTMGDKNSPTLKLTSLKEGLYVFKVSVSGDGEYGESYVNVTVHPLKRVNKPPVAIINPANQTVKLPNSNTVLDGSASTDDDRIVLYHWEQVSAPINYQPDLTDSATLQLKNLVQGFYQFRLTVTDSDSAKNSTLANITVIKETDYPPTANAGTDVIIYLPQTEVTLNGNLSTDDKGIKLWEWTKGADNNKAVDMQNTHTPYLHLSNLEIGMYTFKLKVIDTADLDSVAEVRVFVKPANNAYPVANAGSDQEITLPKDSAVLDGSKSHDDVAIKAWKWKQLSGPNDARVATPDAAKTNVSGLTKGDYVFQLTVWDKNKSTNSSITTITVRQMKNQPPKAYAGGDKIFQLPVNIVMLNGSGSTDDLGIVSYKWTRDPSSLAAGTILENSDQSPILKLTNLIPGRYLFQLTVTDGQGAMNFDIASLIVKPDAHEFDEVEMKINADVYWFTEEQQETLVKKLALLLHDQGEISIHIKTISSAQHSHRVILVFTVEKISDEKKSSIISGTTVVSSLKRKLQTDSSLLDFKVLELDTVICQNNCSEHGNCEQATKRCTCESFWMENFIRVNFGDKESNCDWSILYVVIIIFAVLISTLGLIWSISCLCRRIRCRRPRKRHKYTVLENGSDRENLSMLPKGKLEPSSLMVSDSDLESDTIFDQKLVSDKLKNHPYNRQANGFLHATKKVKT